MKKKVTQTSCDFCSKEIEKSTPTVKGEADLNGDSIILFEIKLSSPDRRGFGPDICPACVFKAVASVAPKPLEQPALIAETDV